MYVCMYVFHIYITYITYIHELWCDSFPVMNMKRNIWDAHIKRHKHSETLD